MPWRSVVTRLNASGFIEHLMQLRHLPREALRFVRRRLGLGSELPEELLPIMEGLTAGDTFVDVGAHTGLFALEAARRVGPTGVVLAIEPNPALLGQLRSAVAGMANVRVAPVAAGAAFGTATLHVFKQDTRSSLLRDGRANRYTLDDRNRIDAVTVPVEPLLQILAQHAIERIAALKIDVEGYEDQILIPFFKTAPKPLWPARVMIERSNHVWTEDCLPYMRSLGYRTVWEGRGDTLLSL